MDTMRSVRVGAQSVRRSEAASHNELATAVAAAGLSAPEDVVDPRDAGPCDWCGGTGVMRVDREPDGSGGGAVPCRCRSGSPGHGLDAQAVAEMDAQVRRTHAATVASLTGTTVTKTCSLCAASYAVKPGDLSSGCPACLADLQREAAPMGRESPPAPARSGGRCDATVLMEIAGVVHEVRLLIDAPTVREQDWPRLLMAAGNVLQSAGDALAGGAQ